MSADTNGIEGVSARYAAQIRELIYEQAMKRLIARRTAQREQADAIREAVNKALVESERPAAEKQPQPAAPARSAPQQADSRGLIVDTRA